MQQDAEWQDYAEGETSYGQYSFHPSDSGQVDGISQRFDEVSIYSMAYGAGLTKDHSITTMAMVVIITMRRLRTSPTLRRQCSFDSRYALILPSPRPSSNFASVKLPPIHSNDRARLCTVYHEYPFCPTLWRPTATAPGKE